jgi:choline dehydrogenase-like flavoprotein
MIDVLVIGSGAGGSPVALRAAQSGLKTLVLEKGPRYAREDFVHDEVAMALRPNFWTPTPGSDPHVVVDAAAADPSPRRSTLGWIASCVGGGTAHMGGALYRFHPDDFRTRSRFGPYESTADWPYGYDDLEPYYSLAEWEVGVSGSGAPHPQQGPRSRPYPLLPLDVHPLAGRFDRACRSLGICPVATPRAVNSQPYAGRPSCAYCAFCAGFGCPNGARGSTLETLLPRAEATGLCEVRAGCMVRRVTVDRSGRATGCIYLDASGQEHRVRARVVCVSCSAVESARLLLLSRSPVFPDGLANGSGLVGHNLQFHVGSAGRGRFPAGAAPASSNPYLGRSVLDHYFLPDGVSAYGKGGLLRFDMERQLPIATGLRLAREGADRWTWGEALQERLRRHPEYDEVEFEVFQDFIPNQRTWTALDPEVTDRWGLPAARIHFDHPPHHGAAAAWLTDRGFEILDAMGAAELIRRPVGYMSHVMTQGTCRAGTDPRESVLNSFCQSHEVRNLFVVDGSFMPTSGGAPTTLTILANAFRSADHLLAEMAAGRIGQ